MTDSIKKIKFKDGFDLEFEILDLGAIYGRKKHMMTEPHRAQFYHILWLEKGRGTHIVDFNPVELKDHSLLFIPPDAVNVFDPEGDYQGKGILFTREFFSKNEADIKYLNTSVLFSSFFKASLLPVNCPDGELNAFLTIMEKEYLREADSARHDILHNMLHVFLLQAEREYHLQGGEKPAQGPERDKLVIFNDLLEDNFRAERSVKSYAAKMALSEKQLHKAATLLTDKTPKQLIDARVVLEAKRLLAHSGISVKEIAYELGFDEPTNFVKYFRKHVLQTPTEFRETYQ